MIERLVWVECGERLPSKQSGKQESEAEPRWTGDWTIWLIASPGLCAANSSWVITATRRTFEFNWCTTNDQPRPSKNSLTQRKNRRRERSFWIIRPNRRQADWRICQRENEEQFREENESKRGDELFEVMFSIDKVNRLGDCQCDAGELVGLQGPFVISSESLS